MKQKKKFSVKVGGGTKDGGTAGPSDPGLTVRILFNTTLFPKVFDTRGAQVGRAALLVMKSANQSQPSDGWDNQIFAVKSPAPAP